jgi:hypothetical protein
VLDRDRDTLGDITPYPTNTRARNSVANGTKRVPENPTQTWERKGIVHRFEMNRRWFFILALASSLLCLPVVKNMIPTANATANSGVIDDPRQPPGGSVGDPDVPGSAGKSLPRGTISRGNTGRASRIVGDDRVVTRVWMLRLRVILLGLRGFYLRF